MLGGSPYHGASRGAKARSLSFESLEERVVLSSQGLVADVSAESPPAVEAAQFAAILTLPDWVHSLGYLQFNLLAPEHVQYLTAQQIASIPDIHAFSQMSAGARAAFSFQQVQALHVSTVRLTLLTPQQISWLSVPQIQSLFHYDFASLAPNQIPTLTPAQIATIPDAGPFSQWSADARAALTAPQVQALNVRNVRATNLTPLQISWLTVPQIQSLYQYDFSYLAPNQIPSLTPAQIATIPDAGPFSQWSADARAALSAPQVQALNVRNVRATNLTPLQISWLTVPQIQSLYQYDFSYLAPNQIPSLTPAQIATIPDAGPFSQWSADARAALTSPQVRALNVGAIGLGLLTPLQVSYLTASQVWTLEMEDFKYLPPSHVPSLTPGQMWSIPDPGPFSQWTPEARAALRSAQVQAMRVGAVGLSLLTPQQVGYLTAAQVWTLQVQDFKYLPPSHVPSLTPGQVSSIPDPGPFSKWTPEARAALRPAQVQALNVRNVRITLLTPQQISWLTVPQVQSLILYDFEFLPPSQVPALTPAQIASIPDPGSLAKWSVAARAALTTPQIQSLNVRAVRLSLLTPSQISRLTIAQIRSLPYVEFSYLTPEQILWLTPDQFATVESGYFLRDFFSDEAQAAITREQLLALSPKAYGEYVTADTPPSNYVPTVEIPIGSDGIAINHALHLEADRVFNLVPHAAATHFTVASGDWTNPAVWQGGQIPGPGAKVVVSAGTVVRFDRFMATSQALQTLRIDGTLTFATNVNTQLTADTIVVYTTGKLIIGTLAAPIANNVSARIIIPDGGPIDRAWDPYMLSRGIISQGTVRMFGKNVTPYSALAQAPQAGDTKLVLSQVPVNWSVGDRILLTGVDQYIAGNHSEERIIRAISGQTVTVDPLQYSHVPPQGFGLSVYAANVTRNIVLASAVEDVPAERPHLMFLHNPNVQIDNISVIGFGRTDKTVPINDPVVVNGVQQPGTGLNPRARYAMHFHHTGVNPEYAPAGVRGSVVLGSPGWGYVNHSSNVEMEKNISYQVVGAGFASEDGNEIGVMRGNLALNSTGSGKQLQTRFAIHDFGHSGHGFWFQGPGVAVIDNIAAGHADGAFTYFTSSAKNNFDAVNLADQSLAAGHDTIPVGAAPLAAFSGNTAFASNNGLQIWFHQTMLTDGESYVNDFTSWNTRTGGIELHYVGQTSIRDSTLIGNVNEFFGVGIFSNHITHDITLTNNRIEGFETGIIAPPRRTNHIVGGAINAIVGIHIAGANDTIRTLNISSVTNVKSASSAQLRGQQQYGIFLDGKIDYIHRSLAAMLAPDRIRFTQGNVTVAVAYFLEQAIGYVPFKSSEARGYVPDEYLDLANWELQQRFGVSLNDEYPASDAVRPNGIYALVDYSPGN